MPHEMHSRPSAPAPDEPAERRHSAGWPAESERFADRADAGRALGVAIADQLHRTRSGEPLLLGLPRGGVAIAKEIAAALDAELDVVVARKVGLPWQPEFGVGAIAGDGPVVFDHGALASAGTTASAIAPSVRKHRLKVHDQQLRYRGDRPAATLADRTVVIVDDGMTPGIVARAAVRAVRAAGPRRIVYAAPVCAAESADWLGTEADDVIHLHSPRDFHALGLWYRDFTPVTDDDVASILALAWNPKTTSAVG